MTGQGSFQNAGRPRPSVTAPRVVLGRETPPRPQAGHRSKARHLEDLAEGRGAPASPDRGLGSPQRSARLRGWRCRRALRRAVLFPRTRTQVTRGRQRAAAKWTFLEEVTSWSEELAGAGVGCQMASARVHPGGVGEGLGQPLPFGRRGLSSGHRSCSELTTA